MSHPRAIYVETTTRCNLRCAMCPKHGQQAHVAETDMAFATFERLTPSLPSCRILRLNGLGEPLLHPRLADIISLARRHMAQDADIGFQTNGLLFTGDAAQSVVEAGVDRICFSVDSLRENAARQHGGPSAATVGQHMRDAAALAHARGARPLHIGCQMVISRENMEELPQMIAWTAAQGGEFFIVSHLLPYSAQAADSQLFDFDTDEARTRFEAEARHAATEGLDLRTFYRVAWKYSKTSDEQRVAQKVSHMLDAAMRHGTPLNLQRLIHRKPDARDRLPEIFAAAKEMAERHGVQLELPSLTAHKHRACTFAEEGWAFVDVRGAVSPCHFLWHAAVCWAGGLRKKVWPVFWGNIHETPLHILWEAPAWRAFRREAAAWEMPDCFSCDAACPDMKGEFGPFEVDCYGTTVPCGHCPWSHGALRCMA